MLALAGALRHEDGEQLFFRIDPEERAAAAAPEELADRARERRHAVMGADRKAKAKTMAGRQQRAVDLHAWVEVVGCHQLQRLAADDALAVERAAIEQHLAEP